MTKLFEKEFDLKSAIEYLEFWKPIDGPGKMMILWSKMGDERIRKIVVKMGHRLDKIDYNVSVNILKKAFGKAGIVRTHRILLEAFREEWNPDICVKCGGLGCGECL